MLFAQLFYFLNKSFYVSKQLDYDFTYRELVNNKNYPNFTGLTNYCYQISCGLEHLHSKDIITTGVFVETHTKLPDSMASARIIEILDIYLNLGVDYKPLEKAAKEFEDKLKDYVGKIDKNTEKTDVHNKKVNYFG